MAPVVDLSQFAQRSASQAQSAQEGNLSASGTGENERAHAGAEVVPGAWEIQLTKDNLESVVATSMKLPVIVVFHSAHSPHSAQLVELFQGLAARMSGRFQLAKVDTDTEREVTAAFGVNAVPTAAAIMQGQPVPLFQGLPDDGGIADTLEKLLQAAAQHGLTAVLSGDVQAEPEQPELPPLHRQGQDALAAGDLMAAREAYSQALKENPGDADAQRALYQVGLYERLRDNNPEGSPELAQSLLEAANAGVAEDVEPHLIAADIELAYGYADAAFARLIAVIAETEGDAKERVRTRLLELFTIEGNQSELVKQARKQLTNVLF